MLRSAGGRSGGKVPMRGGLNGRRLPTVIIVPTYSSAEQYGQFECDDLPIRGQCPASSVQISSTIPPSDALLWGPWEHHHLEVATHASVNLEIQRAALEQCLLDGSPPPSPRAEVASPAAVTAVPLSNRKGVCSVSPRGRSGGRTGDSGIGVDTDESRTPRRKRRQHAKKVVQAKMRKSLELVAEKQLELDASCSKLRQGTDDGGQWRGAVVGLLTAVVAAVLLGALAVRHGLLQAGPRIDAIAAELRPMVQNWAPQALRPGDHPLDEPESALRESWRQLEHACAPRRRGLAEGVIADTERRAHRAGAVLSAHPPQASPPSALSSPGSPTGPSAGAAPAGAPAGHQRARVPPLHPLVTPRPPPGAAVDTTAPDARGGGSDNSTSSATSAGECREFADSAGFARSPQTVSGFTEDFWTGGQHWQRVEHEDAADGWVYVPSAAQLSSPHTVSPTYRSPLADTPDAAASAACPPMPAARRP
eukprot:TRINITY_DN18200_c0_g1_i1.p1 TRINITY_DN18200_c0_g1~~TRINITY_DN18200_c0_g1_i1.p1  ORF type:complete len:521 (+),score=89.30 TRINITY_DN18200_c0_g1_i1:132-1565(+)